jgi:hypothetical protein
MIPAVLMWLQTLNDPNDIIPMGFFYVLSYYVVTAFTTFKRARPGYNGPWRKGGPGDIGTSIVWCLAACVLIMSLLDLLSRNELSLKQLLLYYVLFLFLFAFVYNILEWHFPGTIDGLLPGWPGELQCLSMSIQTMTTGDYTSAKPAKPIAETLSSVQLLLGVLMVAVFIAKAVAATTSSGASSSP